jgi:hypothetical protein
MTFLALMFSIAFLIVQTIRFWIANSEAASSLAKWTVADGKLHEQDNELAAVRGNLARRDETIDGLNAELRKLKDDHRTRIETRDLADAKVVGTHKVQVEYLTRKVECRDADIEALRSTLAEQNRKSRAFDAIVDLIRKDEK